MWNLKVKDRGFRRESVEAAFFGKVARKVHDVADSYLQSSPDLAGRADPESRVLRDGGVRLVVAGEGMLDPEKEFDNEERTLEPEATIGESEVLEGITDAVRRGLSPHVLEMWLAAEKEA